MQPLSPVISYLMPVRLPVLLSGCGFFAADDGLYYGDDEFDHDDDEYEEIDDGIEYDSDDDMNDPEHRLDYILKINKQWKSA